MAETTSELRQSQYKRLTTDLLDFYDEFAELQDLQAFLCDATAALIQSETELDQATLEGLRTFSHDSKEAAVALKEKLRAIVERCRMSGLG